MLGQDWYELLVGTGSRLVAGTCLYWVNPGMAAKFGP